jgi:hypothetical protein
MFVSRYVTGISDCDERTIPRNNQNSLHLIVTLVKVIELALVVTPRVLLIPDTEISSAVLFTSRNFQIPKFFKLLRLKNCKFCDMMRHSQMKSADISEGHFASVSGMEYIATFFFNSKFSGFGRFFKL